MIAEFKHVRLKQLSVINHAHPDGFVMAARLGPLKQAPSLQETGRDAILAAIDFGS